MVILAGNGISDSSSNPGRDCFSFSAHVLGKRHGSIFTLLIVGQTGFSDLGTATSLEKNDLNSNKLNSA